MFQLVCTQGKEPPTLQDLKKHALSNTSHLKTCPAKFVPSFSNGNMHHEKLLQLQILLSVLMISVLGNERVIFRLML